MTENFTKMTSFINAREEEEEEQAQELFPLKRLLFEDDHIFSRSLYAYK